MPDGTPPDDGTPPEGKPPEGQEPKPGETSSTKPPEGDGDRVYDKSYVQQLRRESAGLRERLAALEQEKQEREDAEKTELELATSRAAKAESELAEERIWRLRLEVAAERGLDANAVQFLHGSTREELEHRADELAKLLTDKGKPPGSGFDPGARTPPPATGTPEEEHNALLLRALGRGRT